MRRMLPIRQISNWKSKQIIGRTLPTRQLISLPTRQVNVANEANNWKNVANKANNWKSKQIIGRTLHKANNWKRVANRTNNWKNVAKSCQQGK